MPSAPAFRFKVFLHDLCDLVAERLPRNGTVHEIKATTASEIKHLIPTFSPLQRALITFVADCTATSTVSCVTEVTHEDQEW
jgi:hypothetical protein